MYVIHVPVTRHRLAAAAAVAAVLMAMAALLGGCFGGGEAATVMLPTDQERTAYLRDLGWQVESEPVETLDLQLPASLSETWGDYAALQSSQSLPFADYAGQPVRRYTYLVTNYPGVETGVQANLFLCDDVLIGGDIVATGKGGFQHGLQFPAI